MGMSRQRLSSKRLWGLVIVVLGAIGTFLGGVITGIGNQLGQGIAQHLAYILAWYLSLSRSVQILVGLLVAAIFVIATWGAEEYRRRAIAIYDAPYKQPDAIWMVLLLPFLSVASLFGGVDTRSRDENRTISDWSGSNSPVVPPGPNDVGTKTEPALRGGAIVQPGPTQLLLPLTRAPEDDIELHRAPYFVGRQDALAWLQQHFDDQGTSTKVLAITGLPGTGKTTLVAEAIHREKTRRFRDGVAVVPHDAMKDVPSTLRKILSRFHPHREDPRSTDDKELPQLVQATLVDRDAIIVLDAVPSEFSEVTVKSLISSLSGLGPQLVVILTCQQSISYDILPEQDQLTLTGLSPTMALELFARIYTVGAHIPVDSSNNWNSPAVDLLSPEDRTAAGNIVTLLGGHAVAIVSIAATAHDTHQNLPQLAKELRLNLLAAANPVQRVLIRCIEGLDADAHQLLVAFSAFGTAEAGREAILALAKGIGIRSPTASLDTLVHRSLLTFNDPSGTRKHNRLVIHPLVRAIMQDEFKAWERNSPSRAREASKAIAEYYAAYLSTAEDTDITPYVRNITHALDWALSHGIDSLVVEICHGMRLYWHSRWMTKDSLHYLRDERTVNKAKARARKTRDAIDIDKAAALSLTYGRLMRRTGKIAEAQGRFKEDLTLRRKQHELAAQAEVLHQLAQLARARWQLAQAQRYCDQAIALARQAHRPKIEGLALAQLGKVARARGELAKAELYFSAAKQVFHSIGDKLEEGVATGYLARVERTRGRLCMAERYLDESESLANHVQDLREVGVVISQRARILQSRGHLIEAESLLKQSITIARAVIDRQGQGTNLEYRGRIRRIRGDLQHAEQDFTESYNIAKSIDDYQTQTAALSHLGRSYRIRVEVENLSLQARIRLSWRASRNLKRSLRISRHARASRSIGLSLSMLGEDALARGHFLRARYYLTRGLSLLRKVEDRHGEAVTLWLLGRLFLYQKKSDGAEGYARAAFTISRTMQDRRYMGLALRLQAQVAEYRNDWSTAVELHQKSLRFFLHMTAGRHISRHTLLRADYYAQPTIDMPLTLMSIGQLLATRLNRQNEGRRYLALSEQLYIDMGMPVSARKVHKLTDRLFRNRMVG